MVELKIRKLGTKPPGWKKGDPTPYLLERYDPMKDEQKNTVLVNTAQGITNKIELEKNIAGLSKKIAEASTLKQKYEEALENLERLEKE